MTPAKPVSHEEAREMAERSRTTRWEYDGSAQLLLDYISQRESAERELTEKLRAAEAENERIKSERLWEIIDREGRTGGNRVRLRSALDALAALDKKL